MLSIDRLLVDSEESFFFFVQFVSPCSFESILEICLRIDCCTAKYCNVMERASFLKIELKL